VHSALSEDGYAQHLGVAAWALSESGDVTTFGTPAVRQERELGAMYSDDPKRTGTIVSLSGALHEGAHLTVDPDDRGSDEPFGKAAERWRFAGR
jgi:hypothetical protein